MNEHPVPQQISAFQFKLFGNLTLRQFIFVGSSGLLAWFLIYTVKQPFISFPLAFLIFTTGLSIAVVPFQGRPLDQWFFAFINVLFSPTLRVYKKDEEVPDFLKPQPVEKAEPTLKSFAQTEKKLQLEEYLKKYTQKEVSRLDLDEKTRLASLTFDTNNLPPIPFLPAQTRSSLPGFGQKEVVEAGNLKLALSFGSPTIAVKNPNQTTYFSEIGRPRVRKLGVLQNNGEPLQPAASTSSMLNTAEPQDFFEYSPNSTPSTTPSSSFVQDTSVSPSLLRREASTSQGGSASPTPFPSIQPSASFEPETPPQPETTQKPDQNENQSLNLPTPSFVPD